MNPLFWYPPAETRISTKSFIDALLGKNHDFEKDLCSYLGVESCILGNSGRALMTLLLQALKKADTGNRNEVLIPAYTCYSVAASVVKAGLKISVYDLDPQTLRPDADSLKNAAGNKTLAIVYQHLFGIPQPREDFDDISIEHSIPLIEDAAQGLGGFLNSKPLGALGDFSIFSFGRGKPLPIGTGGALTGKKHALDTIPTPSSAKGRGQLITSAAVQALSHPLLYGIMEKLPLGLGKTVFDPGFALSGMPAAMKMLAKSSLAGLESFNAHRRAIAGVYQSGLDSTHTVEEQAGAGPVYTRFPFFAGPKRISPQLYRLGVRRMYPEAIAAEPVIKTYLANPGQPAPGAKQIARNLITLPTHSRITLPIARKILAVLQEEYHC
ncbi:MAG: DegT/DnrJ/EryC1/StrS family aminotransferase [Desulfomonilia bacterium]